MNIPIAMFESNVFQIANKLNSDSPCYLCARMRRGYLYDKAKELGCNKIALGHHYDDVIETILLSILYEGEFRTMMPKLHSDNFEGMELIRPLYLVKENDIIKWRDYNELSFLNCACKFTERNQKENTSKRKEIKDLVKKFRDTNKYIEYNIFKSVENVNLKTIISYCNGEEKKHFLDDYDKRR